MTSIYEILRDHMVQVGFDRDGCWLTATCEGEGCYFGLHEREDVMTGRELTDAAARHQAVLVEDFLKNGIVKYIVRYYSPYDPSSSIIASFTDATMAIEAADKWCEAGLVYVDKVQGKEETEIYRRVINE